MEWSMWSTVDASYSSWMREHWVNSVVHSFPWNSYKFFQSCLMRCLARWEMLPSSTTSWLLLVRFLYSFLVIVHTKFCQSCNYFSDWWRDLRHLSASCPLVPCSPPCVLPLGTWGLLWRGCPGGWDRVPHHPDHHQERALLLPRAER